MPGLFSWKSRIRSRKTPEKTQATLLDLSAGREGKRAVRFDFQGVGRNRDGADSPHDWQYGSDTPAAKAPLAIEEDVRDQRQPIVVKPTGRASAVLQHLREEPRVHQIREAHSPPPARVERPISVPSVVFLEVNDEVKRAILPPVLETIDSVKALFLRTFPQMTAKYLNLPYVKIYIQEPSKGQLFYELDDLRDIKDRAVLKLREQLTGFQSPQPIRFTDHPPDYLSESEGELSDYRSRTPHRIGSLRPPSSLDKRTYAPPIKSTRSPIPSRFDAYYDPYSSDASSQDVRSGSATPIVDKEARFRMETMERQLAGLSSLVHSALVSKGMSETSQRDMQELRKQILALHPDVRPASSVPSSTEPSLPDTYSLNGEAQQHLLKLKQQASDVHNQLKQVKRAVQVNVQSSRDLLREAFDQIQKQLSKQTGAVDAAGIKADHIENLKSEHIAQITQLQKSLQSFEEDVEDVRKLVLNTNRKLRMSEVEHFTNSLTKIGRNAARLKTQFPSIQAELEKKIKSDMERVVHEEQFIKEESVQIDQCLRRCKTLANMMVTMKKLAMVQDPAVSGPYRMERAGDRMSTRSENGAIATCGEVNGIRVGPEPAPANAPAMPSSGLVLVGQNLSTRASAPPSGRAVKEGESVSVSVTVPPPVPPSPHNYEKPSTSDKYEETHMLDAILDELNSTRKPPPAISVNGPPKPPERRSSSDLRSRFTPAEVKEIQQRPPKGPLSPMLNAAIRPPPPFPVTTASARPPPPPFYVPSVNTRAPLPYRPASAQPRTPSKYAESFPDHFQRPPEAIASTDALGANDAMRANGASSNESLNSQEGISVIQK